MTLLASLADFRLFLSLKQPNIFALWTSTFVVMQIQSKVLVFLSKLSSHSVHDLLQRVHIEMALCKKHKV